MQERLEDKREAEEVRRLSRAAEAAQLQMRLTQETLQEVSIDTYHYHRCIKIIYKQTQTPFQARLLPTRFEDALGLHMIRDSSRE